MTERCGPSQRVFANRVRNLLGLTSAEIGSTLHETTTVPVEEALRDHEKPDRGGDRGRGLHWRRDRQEIRRRGLHVVCRAPQRRKACAAGEGDRGGGRLGLSALPGPAQKGR